MLVDKRLLRINADSAAAAAASAQVGRLRKSNRPHSFQPYITK
jgi:hypothetical protein